MNEMAKTKLWHVQADLKDEYWHRGFNPKLYFIFHAEDYHAAHAEAKNRLAAHKDGKFYVLGKITSSKEMADTIRRRRTFGHHATNVHLNGSLAARVRRFGELP